MWIFTPFGFFSIVQKTHDASDQLTIRGRVPEQMRMDVPNPGTPSSLSTLFAQGAI